MTDETKTYRFALIDRIEADLAHLKGMTTAHNERFADLAMEQELLRQRLDVLQATVLEIVTLLKEMRENIVGDDS